MNNNRLVAMDLGGTGIRAIAAEIQPDNAVRVISVESKKADNIKCGVIGQPTGTSFNVGTVLKELKNSAGLRDQIRRFSTALGGRGMKIVTASVERKLSRNSLITSQLIDSMAAECEKSFSHPELSVYDTIPVMYEVDGVEIESPENSSGTYIIGNYNLVVGSSQIKDQLQKCIERAYVDIEFLPLAAEAFSLVVSEDFERQDGCAIIEMGHTSTTLAIYQHQILQEIMVVPLGGMHITKDIEEIGITNHNAERLKHLKGAALEQLITEPVNIRIPARNPEDDPVIVTDQFLAMVIEARLDEIFHPVFELLQEYESQIPHGIILTGGAANLTGISDYVQLKSNITTRLGDHSGWLTEDTPPQFSRMEYAQLIGTILLTHSYREEHQESVIEKEESKSKKKSGRRSFRESFTQGIFKFFDDDTALPEDQK